MRTVEELDQKIDELSGLGKSLAEKLGNGDLDSEGQKALGEDIKALNEKVEPLLEERARAQSEASVKAMGERLEGLERVIASAREAGAGGYPFGSPAPDEAAGLYGKKGVQSFYNDVRLATESQPNAKALERLAEAADYSVKAMGEGIAAEGGFLVPTDVSSELIGLRDAGGILRSLFSNASISVDEAEFLRQDNGLAVAWTAEFAQKIKSQLAFSSYSARVFTAAGLVVVSNQLLADSRYPIDRMINTDFAKRFTWLEENAFLTGDGKNQPLGLINTPGVGTTPVKAGEDATKTALAILDAVQDAITEIYTEFYGPPTAIVMHPRTWGALVKARESSTSATYLIGPGSVLSGRTANDSIPGYGSAPLPRGELHGVPVYTTPAVPTNLGGATNESCIFVGDFGQGLVMDRQGITTDNSKHVYFETNQTVFRSEERVGFTAGRYPDAFNIVAGDAFAGI